MKTILFWLIVIVLGAAILFYFKPELFDRVRDLTGSASSSTTVYKWQDDKGVWHVTDAPPPNGVKYQEQQYLHGANVLPTPDGAKSEQH